MQTTTAGREEGVLPEARREVMYGREGGVMNSLLTGNEVKYSSVIIW